MRVTVVMPTHQRPRSLVHALRSLKAQTHPDWEARVVDDGDGAGARAAVALGDPRVHARVNPGRGQVDARNVALAEATGDVVMWLDDDDWLEDRDHMANVVAALADGPALVTCAGWMVEVVPGDDDVPGERSRAPFDVVTTAASLRRDNTLLTAGLAYPRTLHRRLGLLDRELDGYFDWDWTLRVTAAGVPLVKLPGVGVAYRQHPGNRSRHVTDDRRARFARLCAKHGLDAVLKDHAGVLAERAAAERAPGGGRPPRD